MDIAQTLRSYDGRRVAPFREVADAVRDAPGEAMPQLLDLAGSEEPALQVGATWVIKHLAERGSPPGGRVVERVVDLLGRVRAPDAILHLLQTLPHMEIPAGREDELRRTLECLTGSGHAFVRAWAYNGLGLLAAGNPELRGVVEALFDEAAERETAAVRARIRHARAALGSGRIRTYLLPTLTALAAACGGRDANLRATVEVDTVGGVAIVRNESSMRWTAR